MKKIEELYQNYFKDIFLYLKALSKSDDIAEEITQETFFKAMKAIDTFKGECDIRVWLCQIAKNTFYTYCKKNQKIVQEEISKQLSDEAASIEKNILEKEQVVVIHKLLHEMEEPYKEVFHLRVFGELSFREIGEVFGRTESWSRVTFYRAKCKIIEKMEESYENGKL